MYSMSSEESSKQDNIFEEEEDFPMNISSLMGNVIKINIDDNIDIFLDEKKNNISLCPIIPLNKIDILLKLHNLKISKEDILKRILKILNNQKFNTPKKKPKNGIKIERPTNSDKIIITDEHFLKDCMILSQANGESSFIIADRISKAIFDETIKYKYGTSDENKRKYAIAYLKFKDNNYIESGLFDSESEAKLDVCKKIISKFLPRKTAKEIINNINECLIKEEQYNIEKKERYEKFLQEVGGDRILLKNKRKLTHEEFSRRLPYFNVFDADRFKEGNDIYLYEDNKENEELIFFNTANLPINEILLGDLGIVNHHLKDFKYTPLKMFEMLRDSEKKRGVDLKMEYSQINNKNFCVNSVATIFSQKLGLKINGYGMTKEEAGNKCALNMLNILFKNKFKTYFELHDYFKNKNKKYLDIILIDDNIEENKIKEKEINKKENNNDKKNNENNGSDSVNNKIKKVEKNENINSNYSEIAESIPIYFNNAHNLSFENVVVEYNSNLNTDTHESLEYSDINNINISSNYNDKKNNNIGANFGKLFNCNSYDIFNNNSSSNNSYSNKNKNISNTKKSKKNKNKKSSKIKKEK